MDDRNGHIVAVKVFDGAAAVTQDDAGHVVAAINAALDQVLIELVRWTVTVI